jgi:alpha-beta hydrolase superfamily lysophospholipase
MTRGASATRALGWTVILLAIVMSRSPAALASGRSVSFTAPDGTSLAGMFYETSNRPAPGVLLVHMLGRSKDEWSVLADRIQDAGATVLALDLRGHGSSGGTGGTLAPMASDVRAALDWLITRQGVRPDAVAVVGASLGANLAAVVAADASAVRALALLSPSLDYRGVRLDSGVMKKLGDRPVWLAASTEDPYALRSVKDLAAGSASREQRLSAARGHGTALLSADPDLARALVDWLRRTLVF